MANTPTAAELALGPLNHLSVLELRLARRLGVEFADIDRLPPRAAIIGEAPGPNTSPKLPLFPLPRASAGGRLIAYSRIAPASYLGTFLRRNLFRELPRAWDRGEARINAEQILDELRRRGISRAVLLGAKVGAAFGLHDLWSHGFSGCSSLDPDHPFLSIELAVIPHPSGRCRIYNDVAAQRRAGATLRWAARLRRSLP